MSRHLHTMESTNAVSVEGKCCLKAGSRMSVGRPVKASAHTVGVSYAIFRRSPLVGMVSPRTNSSTSLSRYPVNRSTVADSSVGVAVEFMRVVFALPLLKGRFCLELPPGLVRLVVHALFVCVHRDFNERQDARNAVEAWYVACCVRHSLVTARQSPVNAATSSNTPVFAQTSGRGAILSRGFEPTMATDNGGQRSSQLAEGLTKAPHHHRPSTLAKTACANPNNSPPG